MIKIEKQAEPREWLTYRLTPNVVFETIPALKASLLEEQGYICAYCMRRIPCLDRNSNESTRTEHLMSQKDCRDNDMPQETLDYRNLVICCPGAVNDDFHCDKSKGEQSLHFDIFSSTFVDTISYSTKDGSIHSSDSDIDNDLKNVLNLNNAVLKQNRKATLDGVKKMLRSHTAWRRSQINRIISEWESKHLSHNKMLDKDVMQYHAYNGIVIWYLKKRLQHI